MTYLLNERQVIEILHNTTDTNVEIAKKYGVSRDTISKIFSNNGWKHIPRPNLKRNNQRKSRKLTEDIVRAVRNYERTDYEQIAKEYGCLVKTVKLLLCPNNLDWKHIPVKGYENYKGERISAMPLRKSEVKDIFLNRDISIKEMCEKYKVGYDCIRNIRSGKRHGKYTSTLKTADIKSTSKLTLRKTRRSRSPEWKEFSNYTHPFVRFIWNEITDRDLMLKSVADKAGIDPATLYKWREIVKGPYLFQIENVLEALGYKLEIVKINN